MNTLTVFRNKQTNILFLAFIFFAPFFSKAQNLKTTDFVLYGKKVQLNSSCNVVKGSVGALSLIQTTGGVSFGGSLYSDSAIILADNNTVTGVMKANNSRVLSITTGTPISVGKSASLKDSVVAKGNIFIKNGSVKQVFLPTGATYSGPTPTLGKVQVAPNLLVLPVMPPMPATIPITSVGSTNITTTSTITPGNYGDVILSGGKTITLSGPGTYVFKSIKNSGASNSFVFDFQNKTGNFVLLVQGDVNLDKSAVTTVNGGGANYIFTEVLGTGSTLSGNAFNIAPGNSGAAKWLGTVWVPNGNINLANSGNMTSIIGALFTNNTINGSTGNVSVDYAPYINLQQGNNPLIVPSFNTVGLKVEDPIGPQLTALTTNPVTTVTYEDSVFRVIDSKVLIDIIVVNGQYDYLLGILPNSPYGMTGIITTGRPTIITGFFPIANLPLLNALTTSINQVRPVSPPKKLGGVTTTNGDIAQRSNFVRNGYNVNGENVTVGVLSDSYNNQGLAAADVSNDDLPGAGNATNPDVVNVVQDYPYTVFGQASDEGRAMMQIVHDVAPKAKLAFRTGFISEADFALGVRQLADAPNNCDVIVDDIAYITEPFFRDGLVAQSANYVHDLGKTYISAAGNFGGQSYSANFNPVPAPNGMTGFAHNFGTSIYQPLSLTAGTYTIVLQWDNDFYSLGQPNPSPNDLDWYLTDNNGGIIVGMNMNNFHRDPIEVLSFKALANTTANLMVISANGTTTVKFKYIIMRGGATITGYTGSSTIVGQANASGALSVGAARYTQTPAYTNGAAPVIEYFSSLGGTTVNGVDRNKPDFVAPDGGNTTIDFHSLNLEDGAHGVPLESPVYPNFFGTSAAAPHAGGVAALLISGSKKFRGTGMASDEIKSLLQSTAIDMNASGLDNISGAGLIQADKAMNTFAAPTPGLITVTVPSNITGPTTSTFTVTITGHFFTSGSTVYERDQALTTTIIVNDSTATATVNGFSGNPAIRVYTPPRATGDGGFSNSINLLNIPKKKVVVTADNKSKLYGEPLPAFTSTILVDNVPLANSGLTLHDLGLDGGRLIYATPASTLSDATNYNIIPSMNPPLDITKVADKALDELYEYTFVKGALTVNKLPLTITPNDQTIAYGDAVNVTFNYTLGSQNITAADASTIQSNLVLDHQGSMAPNTVALVDAKTITHSFFSDLGFIASSKTITHAKTITHNFSVLDLSPEIFNQYTPTGGTLIDGQSLSSAKTITHGLTVIDGVNVSSTDAVFNATMGDAATNDNTIVVLDADDVNDGQVSTFIPVSLVTGLSVGQWDIIPGAFFTADVFSRDFDIHYANGLLNILPATLEVKVNDASKVYGAPDPALSYSLSGLQYLDDQSVVSGIVLATTTGANATAGQHAITASGGIAANYNINYTPGTLTVAQAPLTVKVNDATRVYGDPNPAFTFAYTGFFYTDNYLAVTVAPTVSTASQTANVGTYDIIPSGGGAANYAFTTYLKGVLTITPAALTVKASDASKVYGAPEPTLGYTLTGLKNLDDQTVVTGVVLTTTVGANATAGQHPITPSGGTATNYTLNYTSGTLTVAKAPLTVKVNNATRVYGDPNPAPTFTYTGLVYTDNNSAISVAPTVSGPLQTANVGTYDLVPSGGLAANYTFTSYLKGTLTITPAPLIVKADDKVLFAGDNLCSFTSTYFTFKGTDNPTNTFSKGPYYSLSIAFSGKACTITITPYGIVQKLTPGNYTISYQTGTLYVNPKGNSCKNVKPSLDCIEPLTNDPNGYTFVAHYSYTNANSTTVMVPLGSDNNIGPTTGFAGQPPTVFPPGTGHFDMRFNGVKHTWTLNTYNGTQKTAATSDASSTSARCPNSLTRRSSDVQETNLDKPNVYPNPAHNTARLFVGTGNVSLKDIIVIDLSGRVFSSVGMKRSSTQIVELDLTLLNNGIYFIKANIDGQTKLFKFEKF